MHYCLEEALLKGVSETELCPDAATTRAMLVTMLWRVEGCPQVNCAMDFDDVATEDWFAEAVCWAVPEEIATGYGDGSFGADDPLTREQLVTILHRYTAKKGWILPGAAADLTVFADTSAVSPWAFSAMEWACGNGLIEGIEQEDGTRALRPQGTATRAQIAAVLQRMLVQMEWKKPAA